MSDFVRVLFDEARNSAWSIDPTTASRINPVDSADASYAKAAATLRRRGHSVLAHQTGELTAEVLASCDVLVLAHPAEPDRERTSATGSATFQSDEIDAVERFVRAGGGLLVLGEHDQERYGSNLNDLLGRFGVKLLSLTVHEGRQHHNGVPSWVLPNLNRSGMTDDILAGVSTACFYRAGALDLADPSAATVLAASSETADPAHAPMAAALLVDRGRVAVFADSDLFGDACITEFDHTTLWSNVVTWAALRFEDSPSATPNSHAVRMHPDWLRLKVTVSRIRAMQTVDGSLDPKNHDVEVARQLLCEAAEAVDALSPLFPHDVNYLAAVASDLRSWARQGVGVPDFLDSLLLFRPDQHRRDGLEHLVVFPMYTQNGNPDRNLEALLIRVVWPEWLAELERQNYANPMFVPVNFIDYTPGYDTNSAVLFPETVAVRETPRFGWGAIFCDREAARFRRVTAEAASVLGLALPPEASRLVHTQSLAQNTFALWDLIHDRTHSHGDLPFDPFMIKQRMPYWMYAIEELRCDLNAFREAVRLEGQGVPYGVPVQYAILFDRLFRFPITGDRVRNYDGLGGQLLFAYLHRTDVLRWTDNKLALDWKRIPAAVTDLGEAIDKLYRDGIDRSRITHWAAAHDLVSQYVAPHPASTWAIGLAAMPPDQAPKVLVDAVLPDEFPLNIFYEALRKKLSTVIASTAGILP